MQTECLWGHQLKCIKLIVLIYLRAVRINQLKVKNWVCKYVPVLAPAPAFRQRAESEKLGDSCDAGHLASHNSLLHLQLTSQAVSCELEFSVANVFLLVKFADRIKNKYTPICIIPCPLQTCQCLSVTQKRRRVSDSVKVSSPSVTHLSRSRDNIVRAC